MELSSGVPGTGAVFALVAYIPGPLGEFLNRLRPELVPSVHLLSHLTILPPRELGAREDALAASLQLRISRMNAFEVELGDVEIFPVTNVIYINVLAGRGTVESVHEELSRLEFAFDEPYEFQPHITLAQDLEPERLLPVYEMARRRWGEWRHQRSFSVGALTLVRNDGLNSWPTVSEHRLAGASLLKTV